MKNRWLIGLATAAMAVTMAFGFVACGDDTTDPAPGGTVDGGETLTDSEIAKRAISTVKGLYGSTEVEATPADYQVIGLTRVGDMTYNYDWTVSSTYEGYENYVSVGKLEGSQVTISIKRTTVDIDYTLKASITVGSATESVEFAKRIPKKSSEDSDTASLSFETIDARTVFTEDQQVYKQNGITFTNNKASSTTPVTNNTSENHVRLYKGSEVIIEFPGIMKIDFHSFDDMYNYRTFLVGNLTATYGADAVTVDEENNIVSLTLATPTDKVQFTCSAGQARLYSIDVEGKAGGLTDAEKVAAAKESLKLAQTNYFMPDTVTLPAEQGGATVTWELKEASSNVSVENGTLKVTSLPTAETEVTLKATLTLNKETTDKEITIKLLPAPTLTNEGTEAKPYTSAEAKTITKLVDEDGYFSLAGEAKAVYVHGYVIKLEGKDGVVWNSEYNNWTNVYIADTKTAETTDDNAILIYRLVADGTVLAQQEGALKVGAEITVRGYLQNYKGNTPEIAAYGDNDVNATSYKYVDDRSPAQKIQDALDLVPATLTVSKTGDTTLPVSSEPDVSFAWTVKGGASLPQGVTLGNGKLSVSELPAEEKTVTLVVTASISGGTSETKDVTVTIKPQGSEPEEGTLTLTKENLFADVTGSGYAAHNKDHSVNGTVVTTNNVMGSTSYFDGTSSHSYGFSVLQFKANGSSLTLKGTFTKIVVVLASSHDYDSADKLTITVGSTTLTETTHSETDANFSDGTYDWKLYTIEYDVTTTGVQTVTISGAAHALYVKSITLTGTPEGGSVTPPGPGGDTEEKTFNPMTSPEAGDYIMGMDVEGEMYYLKGGMNGFYLATSTNVADAKTVKLQSAEGGWLLLCDGQYIEIEKSSDGAHTNAVYKTSPTAGKVWKWNSDHNVLVMTLSDGDYYLGTYWKDGYTNPYNTIGASAVSEWAETKQYRAVLGTLGEGSGTQPEPETDKDKVEAAEKALTLSKTTLTSEGESIDLPDVQGEANISWKMEPSTSDYVTLANGKLTVENLPTDQSVTVKLIATLSVNDETTTKEFTITINKKVVTPQPENGLVLTGESVIGPADDSTAYETGTKQIDGYDIAYTDIANNNTIAVNKVFTPVGFTMLQFKKTSGKIELTGEFTKIVTVILSAYTYDANSMLAVQVGEDVLAISTHSAEEIQIGSVTHYLYTVEYVVTGSGSQKVTFSDTNSFAIYVQSITLTKADSSEPGTEETAQQKVEKALKEVGSEYKVTAAGNYDLPESTVEGVEFSWTVDEEHAETYQVQNSKLVVGDTLPDTQTELTLTLTASCDDHSEEKQVTIIISAKESGPVTPSGSEVTFDFETACDATGATQLNDETAKALFDKASGNSEELFYINVASAYEGTGTGGAKPNTALLKLGASGSGGKVVLGFKKVVTSVTLKAQDFAASGTAKKITVNGEEKDLTVGSSAEITFTLTKPTTLVTITSEERAYIFSVKVTLSDDTAAAESAKIVDALTFVPESINVKDAGDYVLPTSPYTDVAFSWESANTTYSITQDGTKLHVEELPKDAAANFNLTLTATCGSGEQKTKSVAVTVDKYAPKLTFNFESVTDITLGTSLDAAGLKTYLGNAINGQSLSAKFTDCSVDATEKTFYSGDSGLGLYYLKLGKSGNSGKVTLNFSDNVTKVVIVWRGHSGSEGELTVNGTAQTNKSTNVVTQEWELSPSTSVTIGSTKRAYISSIIVYFAEEA